MSTPRQTSAHHAALSDHKSGVATIFSIAVDGAIRPCVPVSDDDTHAAISRGEFPQYLPAHKAGRAGQQDQGGSSGHFASLSDMFGNATRPLDGQPRIVKSQAAFGVRSVKRAHHVERRGAVAQRLVAVRKSFRHVHRQSVFFRQLGTEPAKIGLRAFAHIDDDVVDRTFGAAHELDFGMRRALKVHSAHRAGMRIGADICLHKRRFETVRGKFLRTKSAGEGAAFVHARIEVDQISAG